MGIVEWAISPLGQNVPIHIAWFLIWVALISGMAFLVVHAIYVRYFAKEKEFALDASEPAPSQLPKRIPRHSLWRAPFIGSWQHPCWFCYSQRSCLRWVFNSIG